MTHVRESILAALKTQLERIGSGLAPAGYSWAQAKNPTVYRSRRTGIGELNKPAIFIQVDGENSERTATGGDTTMYSRELNVELVLAIDADPSEVDTLFSQWLHDIELVLGEDYTLGGAINHDIAGNEVREQHDGKPEFEMSVFLTFYYRFLEEDPSVAV